MTKREMCQAKVTLDGHRAVVGGRRNDFATVFDLETGASYEWAWATVEYVLLNKNGAFRS